MASYLIPLRPVPSQIVMATVEDVNYVIKLREIGGRQYLSISSKDVVFAETVLLVSGTEILNNAQNKRNHSLFICKIRIAGVFYLFMNFFVL